MVTWSAVAVFSRQDLLSERQVYRTTGSLVAWWAWTVFAVVLLVVLALHHPDHAALVTAVVVVAITGIMYACALRPRIVASAAGVTVVNPLRVHVLPWPAVIRVDVVHNVRVHYRVPAGEAIVHSWAIQSSGRSRTRSELRARRAARRGTAPEPGYARLPGDGPGRPGGIGGGVHRPAAGRAGQDPGIPGCAAGCSGQPPGALDLGTHRGDSGSVAATAGRDAGLRPAGGLAMRGPEPQSGSRPGPDPRRRVRAAERPGSAESPGFAQTPLT